jgi:tetratricopeptide (TPR) repeat protein
VECFGNPRQPNNDRPVAFFLALSFPMLNDNSNCRCGISVIGIAAIAFAFIGCGTPPTQMPTSDSLYLEAQQHYAKGQNEEALTKLDSSIDAGPTAWAYFLRARIHTQQGNGQAALADCDEGLKLDPGDTKLTWLKGELGKPQQARFQGAFKDPPVGKR